MQPAIGKDKAFIQRFIFVMGQRLDTVHLKDVYIIMLRLCPCVRPYEWEVTGNYSTRAKSLPFSTSLVGLGALQQTAH